MRSLARWPTGRIARVSVAEFMRFAPDDDRRLNGSGLLIVNAPWKFDAALREAWGMVRFGPRHFRRRAHRDAGRRDADRQMKTARTGFPFRAASMKLRKAQAGGAPIGPLSSTVTASGPLRAVTTFMRTGWPGARLWRPALRSTVMWTNTSLPPPSGCTKP